MEMNSSIQITLSSSLFCISLNITYSPVRNTCPLYPKQGRKIFYMNKREMLFLLTCRQAFQSISHLLLEYEQGDLSQVVNQSNHQSFQHN